MGAWCSCAPVQLKADSINGSVLTYHKYIIHKYDFLTKMLPFSKVLNIWSWAPLVACAAIGIK